MKSKKIHVIRITGIIALMIIFIIAVYFCGNEIYKSCISNVEISNISLMFIDGKVYETTLLNKGVYKKPDGRMFVWLVKDDSTYWYNSNYCYEAEIIILVQDDTRCAVKFINNDYSYGDRLIISSNNDLINGNDVFILK